MLLETKTVEKPWGRDTLPAPFTTPAGKRIGEIRDFIEGGREQYGMQTFDQCLADLVAAGEVTFEVAKAAASNPSDFELKMRMFSTLSEGADSGMPTVGRATSPTPMAAISPTVPATPVSGTSAAPIATEPTSLPAVVAVSVNPGAGVTVPLVDVQPQSAATESAAPVRGR